MAYNDIHHHPQKPSFEDTIKLSPLERLYKYRIFPWKMLIHFALVIFTIMQSTIIISSTTSYLRTQERKLLNLFVDSEDKTATDYYRVNYLYSIDDVRSHLRHTVLNYYNIKNHSLDIVEFDDIDKHPVIEFSYIDAYSKVNFTVGKAVSEAEKIMRKLFGYQDNQDFITGFPERKDYYNINETYLGIFEEENVIVKRFLNDVDNFKINFTLFTFYPVSYEVGLQCDKWKIIQTYDFSSRGHIVTQISMNSVPCQDLVNIRYGTREILISRGDMSVYGNIESFINKCSYIHVIVMVLAMISLFITWGQISHLGKIYIESLQKRPNDGQIQFPSTSSDSSIYYNPVFDSESANIPEDSNIIPEEKKEDKDYQTKKKTNTEITPKRHFTAYMRWSVLCLVGHLFQIFGSFLSLSGTSVSTNTEMLVGLGCLIACINIGRYIEFHGDYSTIYDTLLNASPVVIRFLIGVLPIFLGFLFLGTCIFWRSERFSSTYTTMISLFAMMQGDSIYVMFQNLKGVSFFMGQIYCYFFCIIAIIIISNIFIQILEEAYVVTKLHNKTSWVYKYIQLQPELVRMKVHSQNSIDATKNYFKQVKEQPQKVKQMISNSLYSHQILTNKNRALSKPDDLFLEKHKKHTKVKSLSKFSYSRKDMIGVSLRSKTQNSISEHDERKLSDDEESELEIPGKIKIVEDREHQIGQYFSSIEKSFNNIKAHVQVVLALPENKNISRRNSFRDSLFREIDQLDRLARKLKEMWMKILQ